MKEDEFLSIRNHVIIFVIAAIVIALDIFIWRP
jgi:hypothetical protein